MPSSAQTDLVNKSAKEKQYRACLTSLSLTISHDSPYSIPQRTFLRRSSRLQQHCLMYRDTEKSTGFVSRRVLYEPRQLRLHAKWRGESGKARQCNSCLLAASTSTAHARCKSLTCPLQSLTSLQSKPPFIISTWVSQLGER
jgi:hypothetical protein